MPLVVAFDDVKSERTRLKGKPGSPDAAITTFLRAHADAPVAPTAFINRYIGERRSSAHFHQVDQFQIIFDGGGVFGRHPVAPFCVHFSRAYTPYGPLRSDSATGLAFLVLRTRYDPGPQRLPAAREQLQRITGRRPWQITKPVDLVAPAQGVSLREDAEIRDAQGLSACVLGMAPGTSTVLPDPASGDGQYLVVLGGSLVHDGSEHSAMTVVYTRPDERAFQVRAGVHGLQGLLLNFPRVHARAADPASQPIAARE